MVDSKGIIPQLAPCTRSYFNFLEVSVWVTKASQPCLMTGVSKVWDLFDSISCELYASSSFTLQWCSGICNSIFHVPDFYSQNLSWFHLQIVARNLWKQMHCVIVHVCVRVCACGHFEVYKCYVKCAPAQN